LKSKILEFKTRNAISRNSRYKKTEISCPENQNKTRNALQDKRSCLDETLMRTSFSNIPIDISFLVKSCKEIGLEN